jgi:hypothetical protein
VNAGVISWNAVVCVNELDVVEPNNQQATLVTVQLPSGLISKRYLLASTSLADQSVAAVNGFLASDGDILRSGTPAGPNQVWLENLYRTLLNRQADAGGLAGWLQFLADGGTRDEVVRTFLESGEYRSLAPRFGAPPTSEAQALAFVDAVYAELLRRDADAHSRSAYAKRLVQDGAYLEMLEEILASDEYYRLALAYSE